MGMTRKGQLTVIGTQWDEAGEEQTTRTTAAAEYHTGSGSSYILYEESSADGEGITKNMIKLKGSTLELTKKGAVNARMVFEPGQEFMTLYSTPFGSLPFGILTDTVDSVLSEKEVRISAAYSLTCKSPACQSQVSQDLPPQTLATQDPPPQSNVISRCKITIKMLLEG